MARPKQCSGCTKPATIHLTQIVDNKIYKIDMCEDCVHKDAVSDPSLSLGSLMEGDAKGVEMVAPTGAVCPTCGSSQNELKKTGRFGCPDCYEAFAEGIKESLLRVQAGEKHAGKRPRREASKAGQRRRLGELKKSLEEAIGDERFEEAAELRDKINALGA